MVKELKTKEKKKNKEMKSTKKKDKKKNKKKYKIRRGVMLSRAVPINIIGIIFCFLIYLINYMIYKKNYNFTDQIADVFIYVMFFFNIFLFYDYKNNGGFEKKLTQTQKKNMNYLFYATIVISEAIYFSKILFQLLIHFKIM